MSLKVTFCVFEQIFILNFVCFHKKIILSIFNIFSTSVQIVNEFVGRACVALVIQIFVYRFSAIFVAVLIGRRLHADIAGVHTYAFVTRRIACKCIAHIFKDISLKPKSPLLSGICDRK